MYTLTTNLHLDQCVSYTSQFKSVDVMTNKANFGNLEQFGEAVLEFFKKVIDRQYPLQPEGPTDLLEIEQKAQMAFMQSLSNTALPDPSWLKSVVGMITSGETSGDVIEIEGPSGCGKRFIFLNPIKII